MNGELILVAADVAQIGIETVLLAIGEECVFVQAVGPGRQKRNAAELGLGLHFAEGFIRHPQYILAIHLELVGQVAERRCDGHFHAVRGVGQAHHVDAVHDGFLSGIICGDGHKWHQ